MANENPDEIMERISTNKLAREIHLLLKYLLENGVRPQIKAENFGFSKDYSLKFYLYPNFEQI